MTGESSGRVVAPEELKRQINSLATDIVDAIDVLTRDLQRSLLSLADRVEQRMEAIGFGRLSGPVVYDIQEGVKAEAKRFNESARTKIQEITQKKSALAGLGDELSALAAMTASEREALRARLQQEIAASAKSRQELEAELAEAKVKLADLEKRMNSQSTRDARRIDKLQAANETLEAQVKKLEALVKKLEADGLGLKEDTDKARAERDAALKRLKELEGALEAARKKTDALTAAEGRVRTDADALAKKLEQAQLAQQKAAQELSSAQDRIKQLEEQTRQLQTTLTAAEKQAAKSSQELEDLKAKEAKLAKVGTERDSLSKEKTQLEKQLADALARIDKMRADYAKFETIKDRLQFLEARSHVQDILLQKDQHYIVLTTLAGKIVEGKYSCSAKELGYSPTVGISLAAWLDKFFLDLEQEGLVVLQRKAGGGLPTATIDVTEKGRALFEEAKKRAAL